MDLLHAEAQLDRLIESQALRAREVRAAEDAWRAGVRRHVDTRRTERLYEWLGYHRAMIDSHTRNFETLLRRHRVGLRLVEEELGIAAAAEDEGDS